ncbi:DNA repair helicase [Earliella scabrosa]|nr:DNA repair helicase [Earliella scabrosa]
MALKLSTPQHFPAFPFKPYDIQLELMQQVFSSIEDRRVAIMESPTGTGKTLSLLCASLTWLKDEQDRARKGKLNVSEQTDALDWVLAQTIERKKRELEAEDLEYAERLAAARKREAQLRKLARGHVRKKPVSTFLPEGGDDDDENRSNISPAVLALMRKLQQGPSSRDVEKEPTCTKIYYASRTHSQLSQVLLELKKLNIALNVAVPSTDMLPASDDPRPGGKRTASSIDLHVDPPDGEGSGPRAVSLGSRKQLCIHERLRARAGDIDEACRQMLGEKGKKRCPHLPTVDEETMMLDLRDQILATPKDIEELFRAGQAADTCPYFGARRAIPQAQASQTLSITTVCVTDPALQLVLLPYNLLLQKTAREALGIDLTHQVVIIDEAHNLTSTLLSLSTTRLPLRTLSAARHQLSIYLSRFRNRLSTIHSIHLRRLTNFLDELARFAEEWRDEQLKAKAERRVPTSEVVVLTSGELTQRLGRKAEGVNLLEIEKYLRESKIARKISGYSVKTLEKSAGQDAAKLAKLARLANTTPPLHAVESFIVALTASSDDGRVTLSMVDNQVEIKYQHLNPATYFEEVIESARSVILAGGTMSPMSDIVTQLFSGLPKERLATFSCGHIIPESNLQTVILRKGPRGGELQFKFQQRGDDSLIAELGQILLNLVNIVPGGMVVFVPSYGFLHAVMEKWKASGTLEKLNAKKKIFSEPQESTQVDTVLREYAAEIRETAASADADGSGKKRGALLFAVVGAKLSEGLNFTDDLARAVVIVGLPFANLGSPELKERMNYVNRLEQKRLAAGGAKAPGVKDAGTELYENMCMNAVNQSIGRAIRHRGDWAALVLVDGRYAAPRIRGKLPKWIEAGTVVTDSFGQAMKALGGFYREKRGR